MKNPSKHNVGQVHNYIGLFKLGSQTVLRCCPECKWSEDQSVQSPDLGLYLDSRSICTLREMN